MLYVLLEIWCLLG